MSRIDYFRDPNAPQANSVVPSVTAVVRDDGGRLLLIHKTDNDLWALPGGGHDIGERIGDTVVREVAEETGIDVEVDSIVGLYTDPEHVLAYDDGEVRQQFSICFRAHPSGFLAYEQRVKEVRWVNPADLDELDIHSVDDAAHPPRSRRLAARALHRLIVGRDLRQAALNTLRRCMDLRGRALNEPPDDRVRTIPLHDLVQPLSRRGLRPVGRRRHVAVQQGVDQVRPLKLELPSSSILSPRSSASNRAQEW